MRLLVLVFLATSGLVDLARAGLPAGGMDLLADYWRRNGDAADDRVAREEHGPFGGGPLRLAFHAAQIQAVKNNSGDASTASGVVACERLLTGPYFAGLSAGGGESDTLRWTHGEAHLGRIVSDQVALRIGYNSDIYDYPKNKTGTNVSRDRLEGFELGIDLFGSPATGWFVQVSGDVLPIQTDLASGGTRGATEVTVRGSALAGFQIHRNTDFTILAVAMPSLGDQKSVVAQIGAGIALSY